MTRHEPDVVAARYEGLIAQGVYAGRFHHAPSERGFVADVLRAILEPRRESGHAVRVLDCGCGPGEWLDDLAGLAADLELVGLIRMGFDVTPGMVSMARERLAGEPGSVVLWSGDILDPASFRPPDALPFDLVYAFDVIQQLPRSDQRTAVDNMLASTAIGGATVVFDHDRDSRYGRRMGLKKWTTRYTHIPLVPRYYIESAYPRLGRLAAAYAADPRLAVRIEARPVTDKLALVIERLSDG